jgi:hypothetical protein
MLFEWDEGKRRRNIRKHGIDFFRVKAVWAGDVFEYSSAQDHHGEERFLAIGKLDDEFVTVVFTWRGDTRRLISARKARRNEQEDYESKIGRRPR